MKWTHVTPDVLFLWMDPEVKMKTSLLLQVGCRLLQGLAWGARAECSLLFLMSPGEAFP